MKHFSCAIAAQQAKEDPIGTAGHYQTYVLIECPMPWQARVFDSNHIPAALRHYIQASKRDDSIQFLGINRGTAARHAHTTLLIYQQTHLPTSPFSNETSINPVDARRKIYASDRFINQYHGFEYQLESLDQVVPYLQAHWGNQQLGQHTTAYPNQPIVKRDILVCTHGMRDRCCARFGQPLFREARHLSEQGQLPDTRIWQASHIGGHRFAPTAITLPDGRYYGHLSIPVLQAAITRSGDISLLHATYRGWGLLPRPLQVLEKKLLLSQNWPWLNNKVAYRLLTLPATNHPSESSHIYAEFTIKQTDGTLVTHRAQLIRETHPSYCIKTSCSDTSPSALYKYAIAKHSAVQQLRPAVTVHH